MKAIVFGASGTLGSAICLELQTSGFLVTRVSRKSALNFEISLADPEWGEKAAVLGPFDSVVWAQGINSAGSALEVTTDLLMESFEANVLTIISTLRVLHESKALTSKSRGVVLSSIWQEQARPEKFAYMVTKSALAGLVKSVAIDMAEHGFAINAVLPGVIDTPMTREMLSSSQIENIESNSLGGKLANATEVAKTVAWLASSSSSGLNSQFITVDKGWTVKRSV